MVNAVAQISNIPDECDICDKELSNHLVSQNEAQKDTEL